jgi:hypothetical protein
MRAYSEHALDVACSLLFLLNKFIITQINQEAYG